MFDIAFDRIFRNEGNFQKDPADGGNWTGVGAGLGELRGTKYGISARSYPRLDIENLTQERAKRIYRKDWWDRLDMNNYPPSFQYQMLDAAINHGMHNATRILQWAVNVTADGHIGPITLAATTKMEKNDLLMRFLAERLCFMADLKQWPRYGKGWARRIAHNLYCAADDN